MKNVIFRIKNDIAFLYIVQKIFCHCLLLYYFELGPKINKETMIKLNVMHSTKLKKLSEEVNTCKQCYMKNEYRTQKSEKIK